MGRAPVSTRLRPLTLSLPSRGPSHRPGHDSGCGAACECIGNGEGPTFSGCPLAPQLSLLFVRPCRLGKPFVPGPLSRKQRDPLWGPLPTPASRGPCSRVVLRVSPTALSFPPLSTPTHVALSSPFVPALDQTFVETVSASSSGHLSPATPTPACGRRSVSACPATPRQQAACPGPKQTPHACGPPPSGRAHAAPLTQPPSSLT